MFSVIKSYLLKITLLHFLFPATLRHGLLDDVTTRYYSTEIILLKVEKGKNIHKNVLKGDVGLVGH